VRRATSRSTARGIILSSDFQSTSNIWLTDVTDACWSHERAMHSNICVSRPLSWAHGSHSLRTPCPRHFTRGTSASRYVLYCIVSR
jgi:hypothetical protein